MSSKSPIWNSFMTGGCVDELVKALINAGSEKDAVVRQSIGDALVKLGKTQPNLVLSLSCSHLVENAKISQPHRIILLTSMEKIIEVSLDQIDNFLAASVIKECVAEITSVKDGNLDWQIAASSVLVAIARQYCKEVMEELFKKFLPGAIPHFIIIDTLGRMAVSDALIIVPFINDILGRILPLLSEIKQENLRLILSNALEKFCCAIHEYVANIDQAPDKSIQKDTFTTSVQAAFDVLYSQWLLSKELKVKVGVMAALCQMVPILNIEKVYDYLGGLVTSILQLYKKMSDIVTLTQGLEQILQTVTSVNSTRLELHLDNLLTTLFSQVSLNCDSNNNAVTKNRVELLRCFIVLEKAFADKVISMLLQRLEVANEKTRITALIILRHAISNGGSHMSEKKALILSGIRVILSDSNNKVKQNMLQVISAMAYQDYLILEGGEIMVEYMVKLASSQISANHPAVKSNEPESISNEVVCQMSSNMLQLFSVTLDCTEDLFWPYLLEFLLPPAYTAGIGCACNCITSILEKKLTKDSSCIKIAFDKHVNIPQPAAIFVRLLTLSGYPQHDNRNMSLLLALKMMGPLFDDNLSALWLEVIPKLIKYGEGEDFKNATSSWHDLLLKFLTKSLDRVDDENWTACVGEAMGNQIALYQEISEEKHFLFKCLGAVLRKSTKKDVVNRLLDVMYKSVRHNSYLETQGFAAACGFAASSHLDIVLSKLEFITKSVTSKQSSGFFGFLKDQVSSSDESEEKVKATIVLCYGYVCIHSPPSLIVSRLEGCVMRVLLPCFLSLKSLSLKYSALQTTIFIAKSVHKDHLGIVHNFSGRNELLSHVQGIIKQELASTVISSLRPLMLRACCSLVMLEPKLSDIQLKELVSITYRFTITVPDSDELWKQDFYQPSSKTLCSQSLEAMQELLLEIIEKNFTEEDLEIIFCELQSWSSQPSNIERERTIMIINKLINVYQSTYKASPLHLCKMIGRLAGRCTDPSLLVCNTAIDSIHALLQVLQKFSNQMPSDQSIVNNILSLKNRLTKPDAAALFSMANDLAKVLCKLLTLNQLQTFIFQILNGLTDHHDQTSSGCCVILNAVMKIRGMEFEAKVMEEVLKDLFVKLPCITNRQAHTGALRLLRICTLHHLSCVTSFLLNQQVPFSDVITEAWHTLGQDNQLFGIIIDHMLQSLEKSVPFDETMEMKGKSSQLARSATVLSISITCALTELLKVEETANCILERYPQILCAVLIRISDSIEVKASKISRTNEKHGAPNPLNLACDALKQLLRSVSSTDFLKELEEDNVFKLLESESTADQAYRRIAEGLSTHQADHLNQIIILLSSHANSIYDCRRILICSLFAEFVYQNCNNNTNLLELVINNLLGKLTDQCAKVRQQSIRGLGNISNVKLVEIKKYTMSAVSGLMDGMNDKEDFDDAIILEAMNGFRKICLEIDESDIRSILINILLRIKPCFEKENPLIRSAAFNLFGTLAKFATGSSKEIVVEQVHGSIICLLLHLNDSDLLVREACIKTLRDVGHLLSSEEINAMFQSHLLSAETLHYGEFINRLAKLMINDFPDKFNFYIMNVISYFKSHFSQIRSNAAMLVGFLMFNLPDTNYNTVPKQLICNSLTLLLKDVEIDVRIKAVEAMSYLHRL